MLEEAIEFLKKSGKANLCIILINVLVFFIFNMIGSTSDLRFMLTHGAMAEPLLTVSKEYYRLFTSMFLHFTLQHLLYNMILLLFAGDMLEKKVGWFRYLIIYIGGGLIGNILSWVLQIGSEGSIHVSAGASGAVYAVIGAMLWLAFTNVKELGTSYVIRILLLIFLSLADGFSQKSIDNLAHIGGLLGGLFLCILLNLLYIAEDDVRKHLRK